MIMIAGLLYLDTDVWELVTANSLGYFCNFKLGKDTTPLQYQTYQNHNKSHQLNPHKGILVCPQKLNSSSSSSSSYVANTTRGA